MRGHPCPFKAEATRRESPHPPEQLLFFSKDIATGFPFAFDEKNEDNKELKKSFLCTELWVSYQKNIDVFITV